MDKQMIEEIAKELCPHYADGNCYYEMNEVDNCECECEFCWAVSQVLNAGYCKIPENAVVLTREEYDELQKGVKTHNYTAMFDAQSAYRWEQGYLLARKETAEKFAEKLKEALELNCNHTGEQRIMGKEYIIGFEKENCFEIIDEICKEITGEN